MKKIWFVLMALCLTAGNALAVPEGRPVFLTSSQNAQAFEKMLSDRGALKDGVVSMSKVADGLQEWAAGEKLLNDAATDAKFFAAELVKVYGNFLPYDVFLPMAQKGEIRLPPSVLKEDVVKAITPPVASPATTTTAPAPVATTPAFTAEQVAKAAELAGQRAARVELQGFDKAARVLNTQVEALKGELAAAQLAARSADQAQQAALGEAQAKLAEQLAAATKARSDLQQQMVSVSATAASAATATLEPLKASVAGMVTQVESVNSRVGTVEEGVGQNTNSIKSLWFAIAGGVATILLLVLGVARMTTKNAKAIKVVSEVALEATKVAEEVKTEGRKLSRRVDDVVAAIQMKEFSFDDEIVIQNLFSVVIGGGHSLEFTVDGKPFVLKVERVSADYAKIYGIRGQTEDLKIVNIPGRIKRAANKGDLIGVADVIDLPLKRLAA